MVCWGPLPLEQVSSSLCFGNGVRKFDPRELARARAAGAPSPAEIERRKYEIRRGWCDAEGVLRVPPAVECDLEVPPNFRNRPRIIESNETT